MTTFFGSGYIVYRGRKIGIIRNGQNAEHVMKEHAEMNTLHPFTHVKIQQLAKRVCDWKKKGKNRCEGDVTDMQTGYRIGIIADIYPKFASLITAVKKS